MTGLSAARERQAGKRVLFVGHEASRTGAPIMLLHLLRWLRENTDIDFDLLLRRGGELLEDYRHVCPVFELAHKDHGLRPSRLERARDFLRRQSHRTHDHAQTADQLRGILAHRNIGLVYSNTLTNGSLSELRLNAPILCHAHEVDTYIQAMDPAEVAQFRNGAVSYIAVSEATKRSLLKHGVAPERINRVPGFVPLGQAQLPDPQRGLAFRRRYGIPEDAILVGGCGTPHWQKGPDLLVHVARILTRQSNLPLLHFAWVGGSSNYVGFIQLRWDIARAGVEGHFSVIPSLVDPVEYFDSLDILALVSRDDPLPLVAIEAGARGVPLICFEGNAEIVDNDCGIVVPYLDLNLYADSILMLAKDSAQRVALGARLAAKIRSTHEVSIGASQIATIIRLFIRAPSFE